MSIAAENYADVTNFANAWNYRIDVATMTVGDGTRSESYFGDALHYVDLESLVGHSAPELSVFLSFRSPSSAWGRWPSLLSIDLPSGVRSTG